MIEQIKLKINNNQKLSDEECLWVLQSDPSNFLSIVDAAYQIRYQYWKKDVQIHIINNVANGHCPEDCGYCSQSKDSKSPITKYTMKTDEEIFNEAKIAKSNGAFRYCMVMSGRGPSDVKVNQVCQSIKRIKNELGLQVCLSAGLVNKDQAKLLKEAGLDRLNHNLNTTKELYKDVCSTHSYEDRVATLEAARSQNIELCSGMIVGMTETDEDVISLSRVFDEKKIESIPVNFFIPVPGTVLQDFRNMNPEYCIRVLSLVRFLNPTAEIRVAAGREYHLKSLQTMSLYPANSLFINGYLNAKGDTVDATVNMIQAAGFTVTGLSSSDLAISTDNQNQQQPIDNTSNIAIKTEDCLRPAQAVNN